MIEAYIDQIIKMDILADSITIMDEKGIIRYFKIFNKKVVPFMFTEIVGKHFLEVFTDIRPEESTVMKALRGESTNFHLTHMRDYKGRFHEVLECVYPIYMERQIIGAVCITRTKELLSSPSHVIELQSLDTKQEHIFELTDIIGISPMMQNLKVQIMQVAETDANVLIYGETGTGKEMVAQAIHSFSSRKRKVFYAQNCAAIPSTLTESIFFGTEKGIYTGSVSRSGIMEQANQGTLFLDEINSLDLNIQAKLLKALEDKKFRRLGSEKVILADFRMISAMNEDPFDCISNKKIRSDLFYRLSTVILRITPLRERREDIEILSEYFIKQNNNNKNNPHQVFGLTPKTLQLLQEYDWPGNVRELKNAIESAFVFSTASLIEPDDLPSYILQSTSHERQNRNVDWCAVRHSEEVEFIQRSYKASLTLKDAMEAYEKKFLQERLQLCQNHSKLARDLGINRQTLLNKIKKYDLDRT